MADSDLILAIKTTADTAGAEKAGASVDRLKDSTKKFTASNVDLKKSTGDSSRAILEFSRGLEDAQYGIRGVVDNIPSLVMAMAGGAGLAGAISIAAVSMSVLGNAFGGAKDNAEELEKKEAAALKAAKDLVDFLHKDDLKIEKQRGDHLTKRLEDTRTLAKLEADSSNAAASLDAQKSKDAATLQIAREKLTLSTLESAMAEATGEKHLLLMKAREDALRRILAAEERIAQIASDLEESKARGKIQSAETILSSATANQAVAAQDHAANKAAADRVADMLVVAVQNRLAKAAFAQENLDRVNQQIASKSTLDTPYSLLGEQRVWQKALIALQNPANIEHRIQDDLDQSRERADKSAASLEKAAKDQQDAASSLQAAAQDLERIQKANAQARQTSAEKASISGQHDLDALGRPITDSAKTALGLLGGPPPGGPKGGFPGMNPESGFPGMGTAKDRLQSLLTDQTPDAQQGKQLLELITELRSTLGTKDSTTLAALDQLIRIVSAQIDAYKTVSQRVTDLESKAAQKR